MVITKVLLILLSGLGVLHGLILAVYLGGYSKVSSRSNSILSLLLFVLSFRIGKSVILEFVDHVSYNVILIGLATLLLIGPLFYLYTQSVLNNTFQVTKRTLLHFILFIPAFIYGILTNAALVKQTPTAVFVVMFCIYYGHYLFYLLYSYRIIRKAKTLSGNAHATQWLQLLCYGLAALWVVYVLNIVEEQVPYVIGPVLYSIIVYGITFMAIKKGYLNQIATAKYKTTPINPREADQLYEDIKNLMVETALFKDANLSLNTLSQYLKVSTQKISMVINQKYQSNFNGFINHFRVRHAKLLLGDKTYQNYTIAYIAYETGFTSLSTFNSAFKKETGKTPSTYRKKVCEQAELLPQSDRQKL